MFICRTNEASSIFSGYKERKVILGGLSEIQYKTCIEFYVFNNTNILYGYDFVYITKKRGCWSHIGECPGEGLY